MEQESDIFGQIDDYLGQQRSIQLQQKQQDYVSSDQEDNQNSEYFSLYQSQNQEVKKINRMNQVSIWQQSLQQEIIGDYPKGLLFSLLKKLIQSIFSDRCLNGSKNRKLRIKMQQSPKQYLKYQELLLNSQIIDLFSRAKIQDTLQQRRYLKTSVSQSNKLYSNKSAVRRLKLFKGVQQYLSPLLVYGFPLQMNINIVQKIVNSAFNFRHSEIKKIYRISQAYWVYIGPQQNNEDQSSIYFYKQECIKQIKKRYVIEYEGIVLNLQTQTYVQFSQFFEHIKNNNMLQLQRSYENSLFSKHQKISRMIRDEQNLKSKFENFYDITNEQKNIRTKQITIPKPLKDQELPDTLSAFFSLYKQLQN